MPASQRIWNPLQMPSSRVLLDGGHDRAEPGNGSRPEIVAIAESAWQDHRVGLLEVGVPVPDEVRFGAGPPGRMQRVEIAVAAGEADHRHTERHPSISIS
jgi:hypothetical protein